MRNAKIGMIAVLCVIAMALCGVLIYGVTGHNIYFFNVVNHAEAKLVYEDEIELDGIEDISILYGMNSTDIYLYEGSGDKLQIKEYSGYELKDRELTTAAVNGSSLTIRGKMRNRVSFAFGYYAGSYAEVWIPSSYSGGLNLETSSGDIKVEPDLSLKADFSAKSSSGDMNMASISAANVTLAASSGKITAKDISTGIDGKKGEINVSVSSGDIFLGQLTGGAELDSSSGYINVEAIAGDTSCSSSSGDISIKRIDGSLEASSSSGYVAVLAGSGDRSVSTTSGDIRLEGVEGVLNINASSGDIRIEAEEGYGSIETTSGDIRLELWSLTGDLNIDSSSGFADITLSEEASFDFKAKTSSGDIDTYFDDDLNFSKKGNSAHGTCGDNPQGYRIDISTTSGDIRVNSGR